MTDATQLAIVKTLLYADVFSYAMYEEQIKHYLISPYKTRARDIDRMLNTLQKKGVIIKKRGEHLYALWDKQSLFRLRVKRKRYARKKLQIAKSIGKILFFIPTIRLVGISGSLALSNAKRSDDIDLFLITSSGTAWVTRLLALGILELFHARRHAKSRRLTNTICLNMIVDYNHISLPFADRDLYSAHEVAQMKPLFDRNQTYTTFRKANQWIGEFLKNSMGGYGERRKMCTTIPLTLPIRFFSFVLSMFEHVARGVQLLYMHSKRTREVVDAGYIRFHPDDARRWVLPRYQKRVTAFTSKSSVLEKKPIYLPLFPTLGAGSLREK